MPELAPRVKVDSIRALGAEVVVIPGPVDRFAKWRTRELSEVTIDYLFVDVSHFKMHDSARSDPVLAACGITTEGDPVFLHLDGVPAESTDACAEFLEDMVARGLGSSALTISDGSPGPCAAYDQVFPHARRQRCLIPPLPEHDREGLRDRPDHRAGRRLGDLRHRR